MLYNATYCYRENNITNIVEDKMIKINTTAAGKERATAKVGTVVELLDFLKRED